jgi:hypothetical protein
MRLKPGMRSAFIDPNVYARADADLCLIVYVCLSAVD